MHLLGCGGMLRVKQTLERLQLNSFNGQPNTPSFCSVEKHDLKRFKLVPRTLQRLVHASLSNHKHPIRHIGSGYSSNWSLILECRLSGYLYFAPLIFLQGPCFSTDGFLGLLKLKAKSWWEHLVNMTETCYHNYSYKWPLVPCLSLATEIHRLCKGNRFSMCRSTTFFLLFYSMFTVLCFIVFFSCAGDAHIAALSQVFTHPNKTSVIKKLDLRYVNVIIISAKNGRLTYVINQFGFVNI